MTAHTQRRWTRWHSDDWMSMVDLDAAGAHTYGAWQGHSTEPPPGIMKPAESLVAAQHQASAYIRDQGHWCTDRCSFWIAEPPVD